jgi:hypothetical protein
MAKKKNPVRRVPRSTTPRTFSDVNSSSAALPAAEAVRSNGRPEAQTAAPARRAGLVTRMGEARPQLPLSQEYRHVPSDLRRLGIFAVSTFVLMIVLGIIIH